jgi:hypothetical protein
MFLILISVDRELETVRSRMFNNRIEPKLKESK